MPSGSPKRGSQSAASLAVWPPTAQCCLMFTFLQVGGCILAVIFCELGPLHTAVHHAQDELALFKVARWVLVLPWILMLIIHAAERYRRTPRTRVLVISGVAMMEFSIAISYYTMLAYGYGVAFQNQRSSDGRPIYTLRWLGWTFAIPTLLFMNMYPIMDTHPPLDVAARIFPQQAVTAAYCLACWLGCILYNPSVGWALIALGCIAYIVQVVDEVVLVCDHLLKSTQPVVKGYSIILVQCIFVIYTCVYLMGNLGFASSYACQRFYTVSDLSLKSCMAGLHVLCWWKDERDLREAEKAE
ncbi:unnamed protein product [Durusdinium trenchii]|uniref:Uncharacterized protein n=2 Tax=Durusdinium trenchii TaxID=1381693 RepID=A0ABP0QNP7_9DINO